MIKNKINKLLNLFGYHIHKEKNKLSFDEIYDQIFKKNKHLVIFDVGANKGQSIKRFKKIFGNNCTIHSFEPIIYEFQKLKELYKNDYNVILNNFALGSQKKKKYFNIYKRTGASSFNNLNENSEWLLERSNQYNVKEKEFKIDTQEVHIHTLDSYCNENNVEKIDILKIDTQGYEEEVIKGAKNILKLNTIGVIETEIIFDDVYDKYLSFSDLEKHFIDEFRFAGIHCYNNNLFEGINFFAELMYINKSLLKKINYGN